MSRRGEADSGFSILDFGFWIGEAHLRLSESVEFEIFLPWWRHWAFFVVGVPNFVFKPESAEESLEGFLAKDDLRRIGGLAIPLLIFRAVEISRGDDAVVVSGGGPEHVPKDAALGVGEKAEKKAIGVRTGNESGREIEIAICAGTHATL